MYWADSIGARRIHAKLSEWEVKYGQFFKPCTYLSERADGGVPLVITMTGHTVYRDILSNSSFYCDICSCRCVIKNQMNFLCRVDK